MKTILDKINLISTVEDGLNLITELINNNTKPNTINAYSTKIAKKVKPLLNDEEYDDFLYARKKLLKKIQAKRRKENIEKVDKRRDEQVILKIDKIEQLLSTLKNSENRYEKLMYIMLCTGRRPVEIAMCADFKVLKDTVLKFPGVRVEGLAKGKAGSNHALNGNFPVLDGTPSEIVKMVKEVKEAFPATDNANFNSRYSTAFRKYVKIHLESIIDERCSLYHLRALYVASTIFVIRKYDKTNRKSTTKLMGDLLGHVGGSSLFNYERFIITE
jgi:hypothetical protein